MAFEGSRNSPFPRAIEDSVSDVADLVRKEYALARAEISEKFANKASGAGFLVAAGLICLVAAVLFLQAAILAIASYGIAMYWAACIVAAAVLVLAIILFAVGRAKMSGPMTPTRTVHQLKKDMSLIKEPTL